MDSIFKSAVGFLPEVNMLTTILVFICTFVLVFVNTRRGPGVPPGPPLFPFVGNLPSIISTDVMGKLSKLRLKYGDIFGLYIGNELIVFVNGYARVHEALVKKGTQFLNRPRGTWLHKNAGMIYALQHQWKERKMFVQTSLQELCFKNGGENIEGIIRREITALVDKFGEFDEGFDNEPFLAVSVANVILTVTFGLRYEFDDEQIKSIFKTISDGVRKHAQKTVLTNCFPFLTKLPGRNIILNVDDEKNHETLLSIYKPRMNQIKQKVWDGDSLVGCFYTKYMPQNDQRPDKDNPFTEYDMVNTCMELIAAGSETTATTLRWTILHLIRQPHIQEKMYKEIEKEIGRDTVPTIKDKARLPYVQAVIYESMRTDSAAPLAIPHTVTKDLVFNGYVLPDNCTVILNIDSCMKDPAVWTDPDVFRPERFMDENGTDVITPKEFIPFSLGQRSCPGESIARMELFLFLTILVQKFEFSAANEGDVPPLKGHIGITWYPKAYQMKVKKR